MQIHSRRKWFSSACGFDSGRQHHHRKANLASGSQKAKHTKRSSSTAPQCCSAAGAPRTVLSRGCPAPCTHGTDAPRGPKQGRDVGQAAHHCGLSTSIYLKPLSLLSSYNRRVIKNKRKFLSVSPRSKEEVKERVSPAGPMFPSLLSQLLSQNKDLYFVQQVLLDRIF